MRKHEQLRLKGCICELFVRDHRVTIVALQIFVYSERIL